MLVLLGQQLMCSESTLCTCNVTYDLCQLTPSTDCLLVVDTQIKVSALLLENVLWDLPKLKVISGIMQCWHESTGAIIASISPVA